MIVSFWLIYCDSVRTEKIIKKYLKSIRVVIKLLSRKKRYDILTAFLATDLVFKYEKYWNILTLLVDLTACVMCIIMSNKVDAINIVIS